MYMLGFLSALCGLDVYVKERIEADEGEFPREAEKTGGKIWLHRNHNAGFCFGTFKNHKELVEKVPLVLTSASTGIFLWLSVRKGRFLERLGFALVTAGAMSNLLDRIRRGYVVDYLSIRVKGLEKVVFNLGDVCIAAGSLLVALTSFLPGSSGKKAGRQKKAAGQKAVRPEKA